MRFQLVVTTSGMRYLREFWWITRAKLPKLIWLQAEGSNSVGMMRRLRLPARTNHSDARSVVVIGATIVR